jgi:hypothetical protein
MISNILVKNMLTAFTESPKTYVFANLRETTESACIPACVCTLSLTHSHTYTRLYESDSNLTVSLLLQNFKINQRLIGNKNRGGALQRPITKKLKRQKLKLHDYGYILWSQDLTQNDINNKIKPSWNAMFFKLKKSRWINRPDTRYEGDS